MFTVGWYLFMQERRSMGLLDAFMSMFKSWPYKNTLINMF